MTVRRSPRLLIALLTPLVLVSTAPACAEQGDSEIGFRALYVTASSTGAGTLGDNGSSPTLSSGPGVELSWLLWPLDELSVELCAAVSAHPLGTVGGSLDGIDGGTLWRIPLSAVAQYRPDFGGPFVPYVGLGVVFNVTTSSAPETLQEHFPDVEFSDDLDLAAQIGIDYRLDTRWSANLDLRFMGMRTTATYAAADGVVDDIDFDLNPWVIGLGFRLRY